MCKFYPDMSALSGSFCNRLVKAGARINPRNKAGMTALMVFASRAHAEEIVAALLAGADASLEDAEGRTALDYLRASHTAMDPLKTERHSTVPISGLIEVMRDGEDLKRSVGLLKTAMRKQATRSR